MRWLVLVPMAVVAEASELNGLDKLPFPLLTAVGFTNQTTGEATVNVTVAGVLHKEGVGLPLSQTVYVNVTGPVTPGGGSKSNPPVAALTLTTPPVGVVVALSAPTVSTDVKPVSPESA